MRFSKAVWSANCPELTRLPHPSERKQHRPGYSGVTDWQLPVAIRRKGSHGRSAIEEETAGKTAWVDVLIAADAEQSDRYDDIH
jgi:hypothetical protein